MNAAPYPLHWPTGWPRTPAHQRKRASFKSKDERGWMKELNALQATERLESELSLLRARDPLLSTNRELRLDGRPRSDKGEPADPGAAIYFSLKGKSIVLACDKWDRVADNIAALAKHIEALRGIDRWGVGTAEQAFAGYQALPAPDPWWVVLGVAPGATFAELEAAYRRAAKVAHPDAGGSRAAWDRLQLAYAQAQTEGGRA